MNKIKTTRSLLSAVIVAAALGLVACGGGDDSKDAASILPAGKVGTIGDGVNASEFAAIQCGMNKDQVTAAIGDAPTTTFGDLGWDYKYAGSSHTQITFNSGGVVSGKNTGPTGKPPTTAVNC